MNLKRLTILTVYSCGCCCLIFLCNIFVYLLAKRIVQLVGSDVQEDLATGVYQNGCSAMVKMTAETTAMKCLNTVLNVMKLLTSNARITDVYRSK